MPFAFGSAQQQVPPTFRGSAVLVTVDAYPQQNGQIVEGLRPDDFEVLEDGKPQHVENFDFVRVEPALADAARTDPNSVKEANTQAADPKNRVFVVYLDTYHVGVDGSHATRQPLVDALNRILAPNDLFGVLTPKMRPSDLTLARKLETIETELTRYWAWGQRFALARDPDEGFIDQCFKGTKVRDGGVERDLADLVIARRREDRTFRSLEELVAYLATLREARTAVLVFTDGWLLYGPDQTLANNAQPSTPGIYGGPGRTPSLIPGIGNPTSSSSQCSAELLRAANLDDTRRLRDLITEANRHNVTFYPVNPGGLAVFDEPLSVGAARPLVEDRDRLTGRIQNLRTLAENTDGIAVVETNDIASGLRRIANDVSAYYLLGYYSTNTKLDGAYHRIQVRMKRPGVTVKARRGYFAPKDTPNAARPATATAAAATVAAPVTEALASLARLRPSAELFVSGVPRGQFLAFVVEIPAAQVEGGKWAQGGVVQATVTGSGGETGAPVAGAIDPGARGGLVIVPLASPGPWRVDVRLTSGAERLEERVTIDPPKPSTLLGEPVVYRAAPGPRAPIQPVADFQFRRTERVHVEWPILRALDQRQARLLGKNGQPLAVAANVTERALSGKDSESSSAGAAASGGGAPLAVNKDSESSMLAVDINLAPLGPGDYVIELTAGAGSSTEQRFIAIRVVQ